MWEERGKKRFSNTPADAVLDGSDDWIFFFLMSWPAGNPLSFQYLIHTNYQMHKKTAIMVSLVLASILAKDCWVGQFVPYYHEPTSPLINLHTP